MHTAILKSGQYGRWGMKRIVFVLVQLAVVCGCATLKPSQGPALRLDHVHLGGATAIAFSPDGGRLASAGHDGTVSVWRVPDGQRVSRGRPHRRAVRGIAWRDGRTILSAAQDGRIALWSATTGRELRAVSGAPVAAMVYDPERDWVIVGRDNGTVQVLNGDDFGPVRQATVADGITALAYHAGTRQIAVATDDATVLLLDDALGIERRFVSPRQVLGLAFAPDGHRLTAGAWFARLDWDLRSGAVRVRDTEHFGAIIAMDFTPDGEQLVTIGRHTDGGVRLVGAQDNQVLRRLTAHGACGWSVRVSPDGRYVATASEDESVRLYDLTVPYEPRFQHEP